MPTMRRYSRLEESEAGPTVNIIQAEVIEIPLSGPLATADAEISGMAWLGNRLIFLPQYPERFSDHSAGLVFSLDKEEILGYLEGQKVGTLQPEPILVTASQMPATISGYDGFEAISITGQRAVLLIEAGQGLFIHGYLIPAVFTPSQNELRLELENLVELPTPINLPNMAYEASLIFEGEALVIFEANGSSINPDPTALQFDPDNQILNRLAFPSIPYRLTDATALDREGRFWGINYFYPGDIFLAADQDSITPHDSIVGRLTPVERLLEFKVEKDQILLDRSHILDLRGDGIGPGRNWEAIARLEDRGMLIATDEHPRTILAFVPFP